jgi:lipopolysaccharide transport system permease protein
VFGALLKAPSDGIPYFLFLVTGAGVWQLFSEGWYIGTRSLQIQRRVLSRIHVPRLVPVLASSSIGVTWFALYAAILCAGLGYYWTAHHHLYVHIGVGLLESCGGILIVAGLALSLSLWTSILGAQARDPRFIVRHLLRLWYYATPVIYPLSALPPKFVTVAQLNPMTTPVEMVRHGLYGVGDVRLEGLIISIGTLLIVGYGGLRFFARSESRALDYL